MSASVAEDTLAFIGERDRFDVELLHHLRRLGKLGALGAIQRLCDAGFVKTRPGDVLTWYVITDAGRAQIQARRSG